VPPLQVSLAPATSRRDRRLFSKAAAAERLGGYQGTIPPSRGTASDIAAALRDAGIERVIAKRKDSHYEPGERSSDWVKLKLETQQELVIGGYRPDGPDSIDALLVGFYEGKELRFAGKVRAGFVPDVRRYSLDFAGPPSCVNAN